MFQYYFEAKSKSEVIEILEKYQNEDGGFGTLDYDFIFSMSCLKQTESACRYIYALDVSDTHPMIPKLMKYIEDNYNETTGEWDKIIDEVYTIVYTDYKEMILCRQQFRNGEIHKG